MSVVYLDSEPQKLEARPGKGLLQSRFAMVGAAPSRKRPKREENEPFGRSSLKMLQKIQGEIEESIYTTNIVKEPLMPKKKPGVRLLREYYPGLVNELRAVFDGVEGVPRVLALGGSAAKFLCPNYKKMREDHGTFFYNPEIEAYVVPTYPFSAAAGDIGRLKILARDLQRFFELPDPVAPEYKLLEKMEEFPPLREGRVFLDIETRAQIIGQTAKGKDIKGDVFNPHQSDIISIGLLNDNDEIPAILENPTTDDLFLLYKNLDEANSILVGQNLQFDLYFLMTKSGSAWTDIPVEDTMLMAHVGGEEIRGLKHLTTMYTDRPGSRAFGGPEDRSYLAEDVLSTREVHRIFYPNLELYATQLLHTLVPHVVETRWRGIPLDEPKLVELQTLYGNRVRTVQAKLEQMAGYDLNWNAPHQVAHFLEEQGVRFTASMKTPTGNPSVAEDVLLILKAEYPICGEILDYREEVKYLSFLDSYEEFIKISPIDRLHAKLKLTGTRTGRLSMSEPNLQQVPRIGPIKTLFRSEFENGYIGLIDLDQAELRIAALLANDAKFAQAIQSADPHRAIAAVVYGVAEDRVTPAQRKKAKGVVFGLLYGGSPSGLAQRVGCTEAEVRRILEEFFGQFPRLNTWLEEEGDRVLETRESTTWFGRTRDLTGLLYSEGPNSVKRKAINTPVQSLTSDVMLVIGAVVAALLKEQELQSRVWFGVHDSTVLSIHPDEVRVVGDLVDQAFSFLSETPLSTFPLWGEIPLTGELIMGETWAHIESTNENYDPKYRRNCSSHESKAILEEPTVEDNQEALNTWADFEKDDSLWGMDFAEEESEADPWV